MESYSDSWYAQRSSSLEASMSGPGTEEAVIFNVIEALKTKRDWDKLYTAFGNKDSYDLIEWLMYDMDSEGMKRIRKHLSSIGVDGLF